MEFFVNSSFLLVLCLYPEWPTDSLSTQWIVYPVTLFTSNYNNPSPLQWSNTMKCKHLKYSISSAYTDAFVTLTNIFWYKMNMQKLAVLLEYTKFDIVPTADVVQIDADVSRGFKMFAQIPENRHCNGWYEWHLEKNYHIIITISRQAMLIRGEEVLTCDIFFTTCFRKMIYNMIWELKMLNSAVSALYFLSFDDHSKFQRGLM